MMDECITGELLAYFDIQCNSHYLVNIAKSDSISIKHFPSIYFYNSNLKDAISKSMCMSFSSGNCLSNLDGPNLFLLGSQLPICQTSPYLGVELDGRLSLTPHMTRVKKSLGNKLALQIK